MADKVKIGVNGKSIREIANDLGVSHSVVSQSIAGIYTGKEETKQRVLQYVELLKNNKVDFNADIYLNIDLIAKVIYNSIKDKRYTHDETKVMITIYDKILSTKNQSHPQDEKEK